MQHVATWKEGDEKWNYHKDAFAHIATHKVSLDPYRLESRRILASIKDVLPAPPLQRVEKASVDEVFLDLSAQIHSILLEKYPEISGPAPYDDPTEFLPRPPTTALDWNSDALIDLDASETEDDDPDWDDIAMLLGSEILRSVRAAIRERLKYTCSAGIARNKMLAKLGSGHKKPNQQTIVRNRAVQHFMGGFKFTKIRNLGGKLGDEVASKFATDEVKDLMAVPIEQLKSKLGDETGSWVYQIVRGEDTTEVNARTQIKSMLSAKSFRPTINTSEQAIRWLRIFVADIQSRLVEEGVLDNKRRPRTLNLHHRQGAQMRSRQAPIPTGRSIDETLLFEIAKNLLGQIIVDGRAWPCSNLQLSVGGFEDGPTRNLGIAGFLVRGDAAEAMGSSERDGDCAPRPAKRPKIENFFPKRDLNQEEAEHLDDADADADAAFNGYPLSDSEDAARFEEGDGSLAALIEKPPNPPNRDMARALHPQASTTAKTARWWCDLCSKHLASTKDEHDDWHFARQLQRQEESVAELRPASTNPSTITGAEGKKLSSGRAKARNKASKNGPIQTKGIEKGQSHLAFGK